jgi:hypothetical protein
MEAGALPLTFLTTPTNGRHDPHFLHAFALLHHPIVAQQCTQVFHIHTLQVPQNIPDAKTPSNSGLKRKRILGKPTDEVKLE